EDVYKSVPVNHYTAVRYVSANYTKIHQVQRQEFALHSNNSLQKPPKVTFGIACVPVFRNVRSVAIRDRNAHLLVKQPYQSSRDEAFHTTTVVLIGYAKEFPNRSVNARP